jgi:glycosyltransferase involved in cell wall biosynthesis
VGSLGRVEAILFLLSGVVMVECVAIISEHASPLAALGGVDSGGQNVYVGQIAKQLAAQGCKVDVFTRRDNEFLPEILKSINGVRIIHVRAGPTTFVRKEALLPFMDEFAENVIAFCKRSKRSYDIVHANFWTSGVVALRLKRDLGLPFVITFHALGRVRRLHQAEADEFPEKRPLIEERIIAETDRVIAECPQDKEDLIHLYHADPFKIAVIPCGFDRAELWPTDKTYARRAIGLDVPEPIILQLGRMVPRKGVETAIQGLARLAQVHGVGARLVVVGGESDEPDPVITPEIGRLQAIAHTEGVSDRVLFTGRRSRQMLRYYYSAADVFVTTPWYEPFGITPVEAMACGTPVIGSNVGGIKTTVSDGKTGFLVPPRDPDVVGGRLAYLCANPELRLSLGQAAQRRAEEHFTWPKVADRIARLYHQVVYGTREVVRPIRRRVSL